MVEDSKDSQADLGKILVTSDHFRPQLIGLHICVVTVPAITTGTYWSKLVLPVVYSEQRPELRKPSQNQCMHGANTHLKDRTYFPCHEMTALEIQSIVASCKYSI